jgi:hypothetical protein
MTNEFVSAILTTCFEGGSNYWIEGVESVVDVPGTKYFADQVAQGGEVDIYGEDGLEGRLTRAKIVKGIHEALSGQAIRDEDYDAGDADNALQYALFGELVYG